MIMMAIITLELSWISFLSYLIRLQQDDLFTDHKNDQTDDDSR